MGSTVQGLKPSRGKRCLSSPEQPDQLCDPPSLLFNETKGELWQGQSKRGMKLTAHIRLVSRWRMTGTIPPLNLHTFTGWTWKALPFLTDGNGGLKRYPRKCYAEFVLSAYKYRNMNAAM